MGQLSSAGGGGGSSTTQLKNFLRSCVGFQLVTDSGWEYLVDFFFGRGKGADVEPDTCGPNCGDLLKCQTLQTKSFMETTFPGRSAALLSPDQAQATV